MLIEIVLCVQQLVFILARHELSYIPENLLNITQSSHDSTSVFLMYLVAASAPQLV